MYFYFTVSRLGLLTSKHKIYRSVLQYSKLWEPDYLIFAQTKTPEYDIINFQMKGFDFAVLEQYQSCVNKLAKTMGIYVHNAYASPHQQLEVQLFKPSSSKADKKYEMKLFERTVQVIDVKSHLMPIFIEAVLTTCPPGVKVDIHENTPEIEEKRYIPNFEVIELQKQLENLKNKKNKI